MEEFNQCLTKNSGFILSVQEQQRYMLKSAEILRFNFCKQNKTLLKIFNSCIKQ